MKNRLTKEQISWILYDWANSSFGIIVVTAVLPIYLTSVGHAAGYRSADTAAFWSYANSISTLIVAMFAPILGTLADFAGVKKRLFNVFTGIGILATLGLALVPGSQFWWLITVFVIANIGYSAANIFYDSFITDVSDNKQMDRVSSLGYGFGYLGGVIPFAIFYVFVLTDVLKGDFAYIVAFVIAAVWWGVWSIPSFITLKAKNTLPKTKTPIKDSIKKATDTLLHIASYPQIALFLLAYFFFIDGVNTIFTVASPFGLAVGISSNNLLIVLLVVQIIAFPFSIIYGQIAKWWGTKKTLILGIGIYIFITLYALVIETAAQFWVLAVLVGSSQGGIQALSRSMFGKMIPKGRSAEFYGFYNIFGKFSAILGPFMFGAFSQITGHVQMGAFSLSILFVIGLIFLLRVKEVE